VPPELRVQLDQDSDKIEVWPDMVPAWSVFLASASQWRWVGVGMGGAMRTGLDMPAVLSIAERLGVEVTPDVLGDLAVLEGAALGVLNRR
jgi:hypothetical protein